MKEPTRLEPELVRHCISRMQVPQLAAPNDIRLPIYWIVLGLLVTGILLCW